jgi:hypothetical protein
MKKTNELIESFVSNLSVNSIPRYGNRSYELLQRDYSYTVTDFNELKNYLKPTRIFRKKILTYEYDAIYPNKPFDRYPLICVLDIKKEYFEGFNFHYLPPKTRMKFLQHLVKNKSVSLNDIYAKCLYSPFKDICSRRYKYNMCTDIREINSKDLDFFGMQKYYYFENSSADLIWSNSVARLRR